MQICPICESTSFTEYRGRPNAMCSKCKSMERMRYVWLYMCERHIVTTGRRFWHFGPEKVLIGPIPNPNI